MISCWKVPKGSESSDIILQLFGKFQKVPNFEFLKLELLWDDSGVLKYLSNYCRNFPMIQINICNGEHGFKLSLNLSESSDVFIFRKVPKSKCSDNYFSIE